MLVGTHIDERAPGAQGARNDDELAAFFEQIENRSFNEEIQPIISEYPEVDGYILAPLKCCLCGCGLACVGLCVRYFVCCGEFKLTKHSRQWLRGVVHTAAESDASTYQRPSRCGVPNTADLRPRFAHPHTHTITVPACRKLERVDCRSFDFVIVCVCVCRKSAADASVS